MIKLINLLILLLIVGFLSLNIYLILVGHSLYVLSIISIIFAVSIGGLYLYVVYGDDEDKGEN